MTLTVDTQYTLDDDLRMKASAAVTASAASSDILDLGEDSFVSGDVVIDVTAIDIAGTDEIYTIVVQGSPDAAFGTAANVHELCQINLGAKQTKITDSDKDDVIGRYVLPMRNRAYDTVFRYVRLYTVCVGATKSITYSAYLCKHKDI